eukprot:CAMPEP_0201505294 /NCGR_PEP_ID=MMETSP0151_2-20130828/85681_1 /ASSEMBLY_ACC=CAM_ASM_000257 /TAXON_ID=200890 /ORGANISM="Paramoeba atlantica, Strain 621/1 / CCAP 1560/9" /LENGTH=292 /DNA_ID=CAMNT_0047899133 /DNA_START=89 /DNA_END=967 /DNA_ORIENTATION=-
MKDHSIVEDITLSSRFSIAMIPLFQDNYAYLFLDNQKREGVVVDPADPKKMASHVSERDVSLSSLLTTHHHWDHAGGNKEFLSIMKTKQQKPIDVYGMDQRIPSLTHFVSDSVPFYLFDQKVKVTPLHTPCHTSGHVVYFVEEQDPSSSSSSSSSSFSPFTPVLFAGDTLFVGGCGRFFEGDGKEMDKSLNQKLSSLPPSTLVCCGHEYTLPNLSFSLSLNPSNHELKEKMSWVKKRREEGKSTVPSTLGEERLYNPFLRLDCEEIRANVGLSHSDPRHVVMDRIRELKNSF